MPLPLVQITHRIAFSSAHRLESPELSDAENARVYGPCYNDHGHNYEVEATVTGAVSARTGMVMNLTDLMRLMQSQVFEPFDHKHLNRDVPALTGIIPTAENIAVVVWRLLEAGVSRFDGCQLTRVRVYESRNNFVEFDGRTIEP